MALLESGDKGTAKAELKSGAIRKTIGRSAP
jgi:hypothetical protein